MGFPVLRSVLVSRVGASHRINLIVRSPLGQNCPRKNVYVTIEENTRNSQLIQLPGVSYLNHGIYMPGIVHRLFFFHPQFTCGYYFTCTLSSGTKKLFSARMVNRELKQTRTAMATKTSPKKRFNEQNNSSALMCVINP